ncbi:hypothetical protein [Streptacidiphilus cavernicola]|uniref:DUF2079 domain-containing protein n=1 Tax=Streptacidiphilus cavernicola TaxID=3342716 RepID=A0ABV6VW28_9ACTN
MSSTFSRIAAGLGRRRRRAARLIRWLGTTALIIIGIIVFIPGTDDSNPTDNISFAAALPIWLFALTWPVWRAPEREAPDGRRWRLRHRRICWRASVLMLFGACFCLLSCGYWEYRRDQGSDYGQYDHLNHLAAMSGTTALWLLLLCPLPALLDFPLWRLWPAPVRRAALLGRIAEKLSEPKRYLLMAPAMIPPPGFDPDQGWLGRPSPVFESLPGPRHGDPVTVGPGAPRTGPGWWDDPFVKGPYPHASVSWDGETITFTDFHRRGTGIPVARVAELVDVRETAARSAHSVLMLLDATGRAVLSLPDQGFHRDELAEVAVAAGIPFRCYELGRSDGRSLRDLLFPLSPDAAPPQRPY